MLFSNEILSRFQMALPPALSGSGAEGAPPAPKFGGERPQSFARDGRPLTSRFAGQTGVSAPSGWRCGSIAL